jgi:hypothetical protein
LNGSIWVSRLAVKKTTNPFGISKSVLRPEIGKEEGNRSLEIVGVKEKRPAISSRGDILAIGFFFWFGEGKVEVTIAKQLPLCSILYPQTIQREKETVTELGDAI